MGHKTLEGGGKGIVAMVAGEVKQRGGKSGGAPAPYMWNWDAQPAERAGGEGGRGVTKRKTMRRGTSEQNLRIKPPVEDWEGRGAIARAG